MKEKTLKNLSYLYIILPIVVFVLGWVKLAISIPIVIFLVISYLQVLLSNKEDNETIIEKKNVYLIYGFCIIFCITAGLGNMFYQSDDWDARNAIYRDIVTKSWPVTYENKYMLVYYIGFWMVPSLAGKLVTSLTTIINKCILNKTGYVITKTLSEIAFGVSNIALLFWGAFGVLLTLIWLIKLLKLKDKKSYWKAIGIFLIFSGLDFLCSFANIEVFEKKHLEFWAYIFQYSSMITQIFWVFNQAIPIWLITLMFYSEKSVKNYIVIIISALAFSPFGAVGLIPLFVCNGIIIMIKNIKEKKLKDFFKEVFSFQNIIFLIGILPMYYFYYFGNASVLSGSENNRIFYTIFYGLENWIGKFSLVLILIMFYFVEVGGFIIFLRKEHKKNALFYVVAISLVFIPIFRIGYSIDFCMRASIPALVLLDLWLVQYFMKEHKKKNLSHIAMIVIVIIGAVTPFTEYYRAFSSIIEARKINLINDKAKTVVDDGEIYSSNFVAEDYKKMSLFYKYYVK